MISVDARIRSLVLDLAREADVAVECSDALQMLQGVHHQVIVSAEHNEDVRDIANTLVEIAKWLRDGWFSERKARNRLRMFVHQQLPIRSTTHEEGFEKWVVSSITTAVGRGTFVREEAWNSKNTNVPGVPTGYKQSVVDVVQPLLEAAGF